MKIIQILEKANIDYKQTITDFGTLLCISFKYSTVWIHSAVKRSNDINYVGCPNFKLNSKIVVHSQKHDSTNF